PRLRGAHGLPSWSVAAACVSRAPMAGTTGRYQNHENGSASTSLNFASRSNVLPESRRQKHRNYSGGQRLSQDLSGGFEWFVTRLSFNIRDQAKASIPVQDP